MVRGLVGATLALLVLLVGLWLALATGSVDSHHRPDWSCIDSNLGGEPPPCAYRDGDGSVVSRTTTFEEVKFPNVRPNVGPCTRCVTFRVPGLSTLPTPTTPAPAPKGR